MLVRKIVTEATHSTELKKMGPAVALCALVSEIPKETIKLKNFDERSLKLQNRARAEKIARENIFILKQKSSDPLVTDVCIRENLINVITAQLDEAVREAHLEIATKQALIQGEAVMMGGKLVTNEELYKQPTDYFREGFSAAREKAALEAGRYAENCRHSDGAHTALIRLAKSIRAMEPDR